MNGHFSARGLWPSTFGGLKLEQSGRIQFCKWSNTTTVSPMPSCSKYYNVMKFEAGSWNIQIKTQVQKCAKHLNLCTMMFYSLKKLHRPPKSFASIIWSKNPFRSQPTFFRRQHRTFPVSRRRFFTHRKFSIGGGDRIFLLHLVENKNFGAETFRFFPGLKWIFSEDFSVSWASSRSLFRAKIRNVARTHFVRRPTKTPSLKWKRHVIGVPSPQGAVKIVSNPYFR